MIYLAAINAVKSAEDIEVVMKMLILAIFLQFAVASVQVATGLSLNLSAVYAEPGMRAIGTVGTVPSGLATFLEPSR